MGIEVPSSSPITLASELINDEHYQKFILADTLGATIGDADTPIFVTVSVSGYTSTPATYQGTALPAAGVHISDLANVDFTELTNGQMATMRLNNRRALFTVNDGQSTVLTNSSTDNYHDTMVTSGEFTPIQTLVAPYTEFFQYTSSNQTRHIYIPLSRSGWKRSSILVSHSLINSVTGDPVDLTCILCGDFGQFDDDVILKSVVISGQPSVSSMKVFTCYSPDANSTEVYVPALDSPLAGVILSVSPSTTAVGSYSVYVSKSA